jgi:DNA-binding LacI/PurR family transcriptional regulator
MQALDQPRRVLLADQAAEAIDREIKAGRWREWLPSERALRRVLNVSRQTVRAALAQLIARRRIAVKPYAGYRILGVRLAAKATAAALPREIGLICPEPVYRMPPRFVQVVDIFRGHCAEAGLNLELLEGQRFMRTEPGRIMPRLLRTHPKACWIIVLANRRLQEWFERSGEPVVVYGNVYAGLSLNSVGIDYHACIRHATSLLLARGHRHLTFIAYDLRRAGEEDSLRGFREACAAHRGGEVAPVVIERPDSDADALCRQLDRALQSPQRPTGFVVSHTHHYAAVATHLALRGLRVPEDVSIICRSEDPFMHFMRPRPTFYRANMETFARLLFDRVRAVAAGTAKPGDQRLLMPELVPGASVAAPPANV